MNLINETIGNVLRATATRFGDRIALTDGEVSLTFSELDRQSVELARGLLSLGVNRGDHVAVWMTNCPAWVAIWIACVKIGAVVVPVNTRLKPEEVHYILHQSDARALVMMDTYWSIDYIGMVSEIVSELAHATDHSICSATLPELKTVICWTDVGHPAILSLDQLQKRGQASVATPLAPQDPALPVIVVYTSGTTGHPKGAMHGHRLMLQAHNFAKALSMAPGDRILGHMPFYHVAGIVGAILPTIILGCTLVTMPHWIPTRALELMETHGVTHFAGIPTHYVDCLDAIGSGRRELPALRSAWIGGAPVTPALVRAVQQKMGVDHIQAVYGMTETSGATVVSRYDDDPEVACSNKGVVIGDYEVRIASPGSSAMMATSEVGEILVRGHLVMQGYYKNEHATKEVLDSDGWFHTGDLGRIDDDGYLSIVGRAKEMFIVGGSNVYPAEVERVIQDHPAVKQAVVIGIPDHRLGEVGRAYVQLHEGKVINEQELISFCRSRLADYKAPRSIVLVDDFPRTATGKIQRHRLYVSPVVS